MSDMEAEALQALDRLLLDQGTSGGKLFLLALLLPSLIFS